MENIKCSQGVDKEPSIFFINDARRRPRRFRLRVRARELSHSLVRECSAPVEEFAKTSLDQLADGWGGGSEEAEQVGTKILETPELFKQC